MVQRERLLKIEHKKGGERERDAVVVKHDAINNTSCTYMCIYFIVLLLLFFNLVLEEQTRKNRRGEKISQSSSSSSSFTTTFARSKTKHKTSSLSLSRPPRVFSAFFRRSGQNGRQNMCARVLSLGVFPLLFMCF
mmetsp:Transcript_6585/g.21969  ORF Transcript_6585/g.21969 Transcript_6585/m.21969 type:complete len:135 (+) Transcript_6585:671-1075(+)